METMDFRSYLPRDEQRAADALTANMTPVQIARWLLENKVRTYNALPGPDDGTGIRCPLCLDRGTVAFIPEGEERLEVGPCTCLPRRRTALRLKQCGMLERSKECTLNRFRTETPTQAAMKDLAMRFLGDETGSWFALCGQSGAGKTHLCTAVFVRLVADKGLDGEYMMYNQALRRMEAELCEGREDLLNRCKAAPLLYIDDLFKTADDQRLTDADLRLTFELIDHRYNNRLRTILSTERTAGALFELDQAVAGRIRERCGPYLLEIRPDPAKNYRFRE